MNIISIGYYSEMPDSKTTDPSIKDFIGKEDVALVDKICKYLTSGVTLAVSPGIATDIINPEKGSIGTLATLTDGTWMWPGDLAYYVQNYKLKLPEEFVQTMERNNWIIPVKEEDIDIDSLTIDGVSPFDS